MSTTVFDITLIGRAVGLHIFCFTILQLSAQNERVEVIVRGMAQYHSPLEEVAFIQALDSNSDSALWSLMVLGVPRCTVKDVDADRSQITSLTAALESKMRGASPEKAASLVFNHVQKQTLKQYEIRALYDDLARDGTYNCLTATALMGRLLVHFGVNCSYQFSPTHVYLIADPKGANVKLETTDPKAGVLVPDKRTKRELLEQYKAYKLLRSDGASNTDLDSLMYVNLSSDTSLTLKGLVALQYRNSALILEETGNHESAIAQYAKSYLLLPLQQSLALLVASLSKSFEGKEIEDLENLESYLKMVVLLSRVTNQLSLDQPAEFASLAENHLVGDGDTIYWNRAYDLFREHLIDSLDQNDLSAIYHSERGRYEAMSGRFREALGEFTLARDLRPRDVRLAHFQNSCIDEILKDHFDKSSLEFTLSDLIERYPTTKDLPAMRRSWWICYLLRANDHFNVDDRKKGQAYLNRFETDYDPKVETVPDALISFAYFSAWRSYTRAQNSFAAKNAILIGLKHDPFSEDLNRVKQYGQ